MSTLNHWIKDAISMIFENLHHYKARKNYNVKLQNEKNVVRTKEQKSLYKLFTEY